MNIMQTLAALQKSTVAARERTGDARIATEARAGQTRVVRWVENGKRTKDAEPLTDWASHEATIVFLDGMQ